jgi:serine/threonine protein kinase
VKTGDLLNERYELLESLGKGGMAEVWKAHDRQTGDTVAVKGLRPEDFLRSFEGNSEVYARQYKLMRERFGREASVLRALAHPNIVTYLDTGMFGDEPYIVMEYIEGLSLREFLERHVLAVSAVAAIITQIARALDCMRLTEPPIVHRDLKPDNIRINTRGVARLIDFGIALPVSPETARYTEQGTTLGSRGYLSPEQHDGLDLTPKSDIYALGCIAYLLLTGEPPFPIEQASQLKRRHCEEVPPPPSTAAQYNVPEAIDDLVMRMLAKEPDERPTASEVIEVVALLLPQPGDPAPNPSLKPDPTAMFRATSDAPSGAGAPPPPRAARGSRWLNRRQVADQLALAKAELDRGQAGPAGRAVIDDLLPRARTEWGPLDRLVRDMELAATDYGRALGDNADGFD